MESDIIITHVGEGKFRVTMENGEVREAGSNLCGIIRFTYFEKYDLPKIGWNVSENKLMEDYLPKMHKRVLDGSLKPNY